MQAVGTGGVGEKRDMPFDSEDFGDLKPEIDYPCRWQYTTIGRSEDLMRQAIGRIMEDLRGEYALDVSHTSRRGKYCSLLLSVTVISQEHRDQIFAALSAHRQIVMVL
jgi:uncharacterized protein